MKSTARLLLWLALVPAASAQAPPPRQELVALLPDDFAICVVMNDLRGNAPRWEQSEWLKSFWASAVGKTVYDTPEMKQFRHWQSDLDKYFDLNWPTLRDEILGDTLLFAYSPGAKARQNEHGLFLLSARKPDRLVEFINKLNKAQLRSKELKSLTTLDYKGTKYHRRVEAAKTHYYVVDGSVLAFTDKEAVLHAFLDRRSVVPPRPSIWTERFTKAGADRAFATLCVNPRMLEPDFGNAKKEDALPSYWRALESLFVTLSIEDEAEVRITIRANAEQMPKWARSTFTANSPASTLWQRFPERSLLTIAARMDFGGTADTLGLLMPEKDRKKLSEDWQRSVGAIISLDPFKDIFPNLGPDWGVCVLPSQNDAHLPIAMFALAVKAGEQGKKVDQDLYKMVQMFASVAVLEHNNKNPKNLLQLKSVMQDKVEVKYLADATLFLPGFQPAFALKDGFLLFATSPEGIEQFRKHDGKPAARAGETPMVRVSTRELAKLLQQRREHIVQKLPEKNLENVVSLLGLFENLTLSQRSEPGQASWSIRLAPKK
jgi:hypothetical protein